MKTKRVMIPAELKELMKSSWYAWQGPLRMPKQMKNAATIVAAQNLSSVIDPGKDVKGKETVKWQGGDGIEEGSPDPSNNSQHVEEPPDGSLRHKVPPTDSLLESRPLSALARG